MQSENWWFDGFAGNTWPTKKLELSIAADPADNCDDGKKNEWDKDNCRIYFGDKWTLRNVMAQGGPVGKQDVDKPWEGWEFYTEADDHGSPSICEYLLGTPSRSTLTYVGCQIPSRRAPPGI